MKQYAVSLLLLGCLQTLFAQQVPNAVSYQAVIRNQDGTVVSNQPVTIRFTVTENTAIGNQIYREKHSVTTNEFGLLNLQVGRGQVEWGDFANINWAANTKFLKVEADPTGGNSFIELGSEELKSVPFAFAARSVTNPPALNSLPDVQTTNLATGKVLKWNGTQWAPENDLTGGNAYIAGPGVGINGNVISNTGDLSNTNEIQTLSISGNNLVLSNGGGSVGIDKSTTNEIQELSLSGSTLSLSNGGGSVTLPSGGGSSYWQSFGGNDIVNSNGGTVFVGPGTYESLFAQGSNNSSTFYSQNGGTGKAIAAEANNGTALELNGLVALRATGTGSSPAGTFNNFSGDGIALQVNGGIGISGGYENYGGTISKGDVLSNFKFGGGLSPGSNNLFDLGSSDRRWKVVYATNGTINTSDARQKQAIQPIGYGIQQVMAMKPVSFEWISNPAEGRKLGFLAQDLQAVVPEVVSDTEWVTDGKDHLVPKKAEALGVYYSDLIPVLTKAIQEQQAQIERLEQRIRELEKK